MPTGPLTVFGLAVRKWRTKRGLTQEELAEKSGLHRNYISDLERGTRNVGLENILALAKALGIKPSKLVDP